MRRWYPIIYSTDTTNNADLVVVLDAVDAYEEEYESARKDVQCEGRIENMSSRISGLTEMRFGQLQDLEAILEHLEQRERRELVKKQQHYLDHYQRALSDRQAKEYADVSDEVKVVRDVRNRVALMRNLYLGIMKGFEYMHFQITNVTKLRCAGLEDAEIGVATRTY